MKRGLRVMMGLWVAVFLLGWAGSAGARVTEKVDAMIAENTPLKVKDTDLWIQIGYPLVGGLQYDKFATTNVALGGGVGSYGNGFAMDLSAKYFFLPGKFSPFLAAGPVLYYTNTNQNFFAVFGTVGVGYYFDGGLGLSLGGTYVGAITKANETFGYPWVNDKLAQASVQFGFHWNY